MTLTTSVAKTYLTLTAVCARPGWTSKIADELLGPPDQVRRRFGGGVYYQYDLQRVMEVEATEAWADAAKKAAPRQQAAVKAAATRAAKLMDLVLNMEIVVPELPLGDIVRAAIESYNSRATQRNGDFGASIHADAEFLARITKNFVRHELTSYDGTIWEDLQRRPGVDYAVEDLKWRINHEIGRVYPALAYADELEQFLAGLRPPSTPQGNPSEHRPLEEDAAVAVVVVRPPSSASMTSPGCSSTTSTASKGPQS